MCSYKQGMYKYKEKLDSFFTPSPPHCCQFTLVSDASENSLEVRSKNIRYKKRFRTELDVAKYTHAATYTFTALFRWAPVLTSQTAPNIATGDEEGEMYSMADAWPGPGEAPLKAIWVQMSNRKLGHILVFVCVIKGRWLPLSSGLTAHSISWISSLCLLMSMHGRWSPYKRLAQVCFHSGILNPRILKRALRRKHGTSKVDTTSMGPVHKLMLENICEVKSTETDLVLWIHWSLKHFCWCKRFLADQS